MGISGIDPNGMPLPAAGGSAATLDASRGSSVQVSRAFPFDWPLQHTLVSSACGLVCGLLKGFGVDYLLLPVPSYLLLVGHRFVFTPISD
jgi:hypothetical protein